jgi:hypothetical protein
LTRDLTISNGTLRRWGVKQTLRRAEQPRRKSGSLQLDFANLPFHILMTLIEAKVEEETVHFANDALLDGG